MKILILKPTSLGDVVHALPVLRLLKKHWPQSRISWWIDSTNVDLLAGDPDIERLFVLNRKRWKSPRHWPELISHILELRREKFDLVIDLQGLARSAITAWFTNGAMTVGVEDRREGAPAFYDMSLPRPSAQTHAVDWYLEVLKGLEVPFTTNFQWMADYPKDRSNLLSKWQLSAKKWIVICPGARWLNKRWPESHFRSAVQIIGQKFPEHCFAVIGGPDDHLLGEEISLALRDRVINLCGKTNLPEMVELLRLCDLLITNDTGPMHIAAALNKPVVALFGPTNPKRTGPYSHLASVLQEEAPPCIPCMKPSCSWPNQIACLKNISPVSVAQAAESSLNRLR